MTYANPDIMLDVVCMAEKPITPTIQTLQTAQTKMSAHNAHEDTLEKKTEKMQQICTKSWLTASYDIVLCRNLHLQSLQNQPKGERCSLPFAESSIASAHADISEL